MNYTLLTNYIICFVLPIAIFFIFLRNFLPAWISVKRSMGTKLLVKINNPVQDYFASGTIDNGFLYYKARKRRDNPDPNRFIFIGKEVQGKTYNAYGVKVIEVDDLKNCIMIRNNASYESVTGYNAEAYDEAQRTALLKPSQEDGFISNKLFQIFVLLGLLLVAILIAINLSETNTIKKMVIDIGTGSAPVWQNFTAMPSVV
jgi:hypothetical protein